MQFESLAFVIIFSQQGELVKKIGSAFRLSEFKPSLLHFSGVNLKQGT